MKTSTEIDKIVPALIKAQQNFPVIDFDSQGQAGPRKYEYASLPHILKLVRPHLLKEGLTVIQGGDEGLYTTSLVHVSGQWIQTSSILDLSGVDDQAAGKSITYRRRYDLNAFLFIAPDEDDDAATSTAQQRKPEKPDGLKSLITRLNVINPDTTDGHKSYLSEMLNGGSPDRITPEQVLACSQSLDKLSDHIRQAKTILKITDTNELLKAANDGLCSEYASIREIPPNRWQDLIKLAGSAASSTPSNR